MQEILNFIWRFCNEDLDNLSEIQDEIYYIVAEIQDGIYADLEDEDVELEIERRLTEKFGE